MKDITKKYTNGEITVVWKPDLCIHSTNCFRGLPGVFDPRRRPWVDMSKAETDAIARQVEKCPSGALSWVRNAGGGHGAPSSVGTPKVTVEVTERGPLLVSGTFELRGSEGAMEVRTGTTALCRCGASMKKPFCDGSHRVVGFGG